MSKTHTIHDDSGCPACGDTGYRGRVLISESFLNDPGLEELIVQGGRSSQLLAYLVESGFTTLKAEAARLILLGETTIREAEREISFDGGRT